MSPNTDPTRCRREVQAPPRPAAARLARQSRAARSRSVDRGVASAHSGVADYELARRLLGHPEDRFCPYLLSFGYPPEGLTLGPLRRRRRRTYDEVVHLGRW